MLLTVPPRSSRIPGGEAYRSLCERLYRQNQFAIKLGTERVRAALDGEGSPDAGYDCVLVAGTNGKGSVCSLLHAGLLGAGLRVGLYTSPHLVEIRERIRVDGRPIGESDFVRLGQQMLDRWGAEVVPAQERLTYFELVTVLAARWFAEQRVDIAVFEIGLGGRLDACNALDPVLSVITPVALDHEKHLGNTLSRIFGEKAGVLRPGRPAVVCRPEGWSVRSTRQVVSGFGPEPVAVQGDLFGSEARVWAAGTDLGEDWIPFEGRHQRVNAACAIQTLTMLPSVSCRVPGRSPLAWLEPVSRARWPGRWQRVPWQGRELVLDAAHNPSGARAAAELLDTEIGRPITLVVAAVGEKKVEGMLDALAPRAARLIAVPLANPRALNPAVLAEHAAGRGIETLVANDIVDALDSAQAHADPIVVAGSLYLIGDVLHHLGLRAEDLPVLA